MTKQSFNLRNTVKSAVAVLAVALMSSGAMAQTFQYTDASGVTCTYEPTVVFGINYVRLYTLDNIPSSVTKWVLPETVPVNGSNYPLRSIRAFAWNTNQNVSTTLTEIVFPKYLFSFETDFSHVNSSQRAFPNIRKITFGEEAQSWGGGVFDYLPLDSIIFLGTNLYLDSEGLFGITILLRAAQQLQKSLFLAVR